MDSSNSESERRSVLRMFGRTTGKNIISDDGESETEENKSQRINVYKCAVLNSNLELVKIYSSFQRKLRTFLVPIGNLKSDKYVKDEEEAQDPLTLFPEEVWTFLLSPRMFTDTKDIVNLSRTCHLFKRILNDTKPQWLFEWIFPFIFDRVSKRDILNIRLVCKMWTTSVDNFLQNYKLHPSYSQISSEKGFGDDYVSCKNSFQFDYYIRLPHPILLDNEQLASRKTRYKNKFLDAMRLHQSNPFIGRSIAIKVESLANFPNDAKTILGDFGNEIYHVTICSVYDIFAPSDLWDFIILILQLCKNLKSLKIVGKLNCRVQFRENIFAPFPSELSRLSTLESLKLDLHNVRIADIQDKLVENYSRNLSRVEFEIWGDYNYSNFDWGNLRELQINQGSSHEILNSLKTTNKMENLRKLSFSLNIEDPYFPYLENIILLTKHFKKLTYLRLELEDDGETLEHICRYTLVPGVIAGNNLTTLELESDAEKIINYDFLLYFLHLNRLIIKHEHDLSRLDDESNEEKFTEVIKISKFLATESLNQDDYDLGEDIYRKSNIWKLLPFLKDFEVVNGVFDKPVNHMFTRQGYDYFWRK